MKKLLLLVAIVAAGYYGLVQYRGSGPIAEYVATTASSSDSELARASESRSSNIHREGHGSVAKLLSDDTAGSRHQKFILRLQSGQTVLVAHNIDIAPRVDSIQEGDIVRFSGEYDWNSKGGVIHWTQHDPNGRHPGGWLKHGGRTYE
jgi:uncharacterized protein DUF3465